MQEPSFTALVRGELARLRSDKASERRAELAGVVQVLGELRPDAEGGLRLEVATASAALARKLLQLLKHELRVPVQVVVRRGNGQRPARPYGLRVSGRSEVERLLNELGVGTARARGLQSRLPSGVGRSRALAAAYLRGLFLASGHVNPPQRGYHLELLLRDAGLAQACRSLLLGYAIPARVGRRRDGYAVYVRGGDPVASFLSLTGAHTALLTFEDARVLRDVRERVNRLTNAETANLEKSVAAAVHQVRDIERLARRPGLHQLPRALREIALARLEHPELSLRELGQLFSPPLSKSAVAHRMRRLQALARAHHDGRSGE